MLKWKRDVHVQNRTVMPTEGLRIKKELTYDTLENRLIKFMIGRLIDKLYDLLDQDRQSTIDGVMKNLILI